MQTLRIIGLLVLLIAFGAAALTGVLAYDSWRFHRPLSEPIEWVSKAYELANEGKCREATNLVSAVSIAGDPLAGAVKAEFHLNERCAMAGDLPNVLEINQSNKEYALADLAGYLRRLGTKSYHDGYAARYHHVQRDFETDLQRYGRSWKSAHVQFERLRNWRACYSSNIMGVPINHVQVAIAMAPHTNGVPKRVQNFAKRRAYCADRTLQFVKLRKQYFGTDFEEPQYRKYLQQAESFGSSDAEFEKLIRDIEDGPRDMCKFGPNSDETYDHCTDRSIELEATEVTVRRQRDGFSDLEQLALGLNWYAPAQAKIAEYLASRKPESAMKESLSLLRPDFDAYFYGRLAEMGNATLSFDLNDVRKRLSEEDQKLAERYAHDHAELMRSWDDKMTLLFGER